MAVLRPTVTSVSVHLFFRDVLLLRINKDPNFVALDATDAQVTDVLLVVFRAGAAKLFQEFQNGMLRNSHAAGRIDRHAFGESCYHSTSFGRAEHVYDVIRRSHYVMSTEVSDQAASRDLKFLVDSRLLISEGETRGRSYVGSDILRAVYYRNYESRSNVDPFIQENCRSQQRHCVSEPTCFR